MNWETFHTAYLASDQMTKDIVDSSAITDCVNTIIAGRQLDSKLKSPLVRIFSSHILNILTTEEVELELKKHELQDVSFVSNTVLNCIKNSKPQTTSEGVETSQTTNEPNPLPTAVPIPPAAPPVIQQSAPATPPTPQASPTPQQPAGVPKIRTMKDDMGQSQGMPPASPAPMNTPKEQTYTSTQEAILKEGSQKPKGEIPPPPPPRAI